jgi:hypothetical protein
MNHERKSFLSGRKEEFSDAAHAPPSLVASISETYLAIQATLRESRDERVLVLSIPPLTTCGNLTGFLKETVREFLATQTMSSIDEGSPNPQL